MQTRSHYQHSNIGQSRYCQRLFDSGALHAYAHSHPGWTIFFLTLWRRYGGPLEVFETLQAFYATAPARWRLMGKITSGFQFFVRNGLHQGCALSVASFNLATAPLVHELQRRYPWITVVAYADDLTVMAPCMQQLQEAVDFSTKYADFTGWAIQPSESFPIGRLALHKEAL